MAPTPDYVPTKYRQDGTVAFEGITRKENGIWEFTMGDSLEVYIMTDNEVDTMVEFSCIIHFYEFYSGITPIPVAYAVFADVVNSSEYSINACDVPDGDGSLEPHGDVLTIEHFFPANDPFFTESTENRIVAAAAEARAWTLTTLGMMGKTMVAAKVEMHNLHRAAQLHAKFETEHDERRAENELKDIVLGPQQQKGSKRDRDNSEAGPSSKKSKTSTDNRHRPKGFFKVFGLDKAKKALEDGDATAMVEDVAPMGAKVN
ncbi:hypothetical protein IW262DRAFT_1291658 [Armillaria fumosa]|nr:hypothetical protein IW262DRAFT_1291658 [Armillaria fumosa]